MSESDQEPKTSRELEIRTPMSIIIFTGVLGLVYLGKLIHPELKQIGTPPFDVFNHLGNPVDSICSASVVGVKAAEILQQRKRSRGQTAKSNQLRAIGFAAGFGALTAANIWIESKVGARLTFIFPNATPDHLDLLYGVIGAAIGAGSLQIIDPAKRKLRITHEREIGRELVASRHPAIAGWI